MYDARYPDHWDTLQIQIAMIACFFANLYSKKKDQTNWKITDFIPKFNLDKEKKQDLSEVALGLALALGDEKSQNLARKKMKERGIEIPDESKEYQYPLEKLLKGRNEDKLPARLRKQRRK